MYRKLYVVMSLLLFVISCGQQQGKQKDNKLVLISPHWEGIEKEFTRAFKKWYQTKTGKTIDLEWIDQGGTSDDLKYVESEFERTPDGIGIDLFFGGGTDTCTRMAEKGLLQPYRLPEAQLKLLREDLFGLPLYDAENYTWYGAAISGFGIIFNKEIIKRFDLPIVEHWTELAHPKLFGLVGAADPRNSGSAHMIYEIVLQSYGWEDGFSVLTQMAGNVKTFAAGSNVITADVRDGKSAYGPAIDFYAYQQMSTLGPEIIGYIIPEEARVFGADPISILKGAPHPEAAKLFVDFVMSLEGQKLWMLRKGTPGGPEEFELQRAAVLPDAYDAVGQNTVVPINPFKLDSAFRYNSPRGGQRWNIVNELIGKLIIDPHPELVAAWKAIIALPEGSSKRIQAMEALTSLPITESKADEINKGKFKDPGFRNTIGSDWLKFARDKYKRARDIASKP